MLGGVLTFESLSPNLVLVQTPLAVPTSPSKFAVMEHVVTSCIGTDKCEFSCFEA